MNDPKKINEMEDISHLDYSTRLLREIQKRVEQQQVSGETPGVYKQYRNFIKAFTHEEYGLTVLSNSFITREDGTKTSTESSKEEAGKLYEELRDLLLDGLPSLPAMHMQYRYISINLRKICLLKYKEDYNSNIEKD